MAASASGEAVGLPRPVVSIHQPAYLPWLGYIDRIRRSDIFIVLDTVPFQKNSFQNRNKIRVANGWTWLTVPVELKGHTERPLCETRIDNRQDWQRKHWATLSQNYARAPFACPVLEWLRPFYETEWTGLADLCCAMLTRHLEAFGVTTEIRRASQMECPASKKGELVADLCRIAGAGSYISGPLGRDYLDESDFSRAGVALAFDSYSHPTYPQFHPGFESHMAAIDLLANVGDPAAVLAQGAPQP